MKFVMPDAYVIIFSMIVLAAIATYFVPAGSFERDTVDGVTEVIPGSYASQESNPANLLDVFQSVQLGLVETADIILLIFVIGGVVSRIETTGASNSGIHTLIDNPKGRYMLLITTVTALFGVLASMRVVGNAVIAFIPRGIGR